MSIKYGKSNGSFNIGYDKPEVGPAIKTKACPGRLYLPQTMEQIVRDL